MIYSRFTRARVGRLVIMLGVACLSFTLGTYAKDLNISDVKHDANSSDSLLNDDFPLSTFIKALQHDFKTDLGGHLAPAQQAANKLSEELKAGHEWCLSVIKGPTTK
jgi:hypothetical protein